MEGITLINELKHYADDRDRYLVFMNDTCAYDHTVAVLTDCRACLVAYATQSGKLRALGVSTEVPSSLVEKFTEFLRGDDALCAALSLDLTSDGVATFVRCLARIVARESKGPS